ncbi:MAG: TetR/AcrR family transcriptional regulator [Candidatus Dormibacteria bacterium]
MARSSRATLIPTEAVEQLLPDRAAAIGTHRRVLEAALVAFGERGFHGVTVREIARDAGIHVSSIYGHTPSKEMLLYELTVLGHQEHQEQVVTAVEAAGDDLLERLTAYVRAHVHVHITYRTLARVSNRELHVLTGVRQKRVVEIRDHSRGILTELIVEGARRGIVHSQQPILAAFMIGGLGLRVSEWWTPEMGYPATEVEDVIVDAAVRILGVR